MGIFPSDDLLTWAEHRPTSVAGPSLEEVVVGCQVFHPPGNSGTIQSRKKYGKGVHLLCMNIIIRALSRVCISHSISSAMNF